MEGESVRISAFFYQLILIMLAFEISGIDGLDEIYEKFGKHVMIVEDDTDKICHLVKTYVERHKSFISGVIVSPSPDLRVEGPYFDNFSAFTSEITSDVMEKIQSYQGRCLKRRYSDESRAAIDTLVVLDCRNIVDVDDYPVLGTLLRDGRCYSITLIVILPPGHASIPVVKRESTYMLEYVGSREEEEE